MRATASRTTWAPRKRTGSGGKRPCRPSTRPQTLSYALTDSPVGQLAWIAEKFKEWTDSTDRPEDAVSRDQMLTNVSLYWLTATAGSSAQLYYVSEHLDADFGRTWAGSALIAAAL